jgi:hypothetical protein
MISQNFTVFRCHHCGEDSPILQVEIFANCFKHSNSTPIFWFNQCLSCGDITGYFKGEELDIDSLENGTKIIMR